MFILSEQRDQDPVGSFQRYREYLKRHTEEFPRGAFSLATSDWWFSLDDRRSPNDAWLERFEVLEVGSGDRSAERATSVRVELLGAFHDMDLTLVYSGVSALWLDAVAIADGHHDWRYDEFRISDEGRLTHEIEWSYLASTARWRIEADDVEYFAEPRQCAT
ncbi:MAG: hypothetical protein AAFQ62_15965 [Pseudomonadota bacterium]